MYGMRFAQIAQDMCNYLDAQTKDLAPNEALVAKKMIIRKLCRGEGLDDMIAPQSALSTKLKQPVGALVPTIGAGSTAGRVALANLDAVLADLDGDGNVVDMSSPDSYSSSSKPSDVPSHRRGPS